MSFTTCTRQRIPALHISRRSLSSNAPSNPSPPASSSKVQSHSTLPPAKMRALVALYHQTDKWITPETLLQRIDQAFVPAGIADKVDMSRIGSSARTRTVVTFEEIEKAKQAMTYAPKMAQWDAGAPMRINAKRIGAESWSANRAKREHKVIEALYGVVTTPDAKLLPGLEVVKESLKDIKEDERKGRSGSDYDYDS